jgi:hypothetical protein
MVSELAAQAEHLRDGADRENEQARDGKIPPEEFKENRLCPLIL